MIICTASCWGSGKIDRCLGEGDGQDEDRVETLMRVWAQGGFNLFVYATNVWF